jgi:hypothetical protein
MLVDSINGKEISTFQKLKTLVLRIYYFISGGCWKIDQNYFFKNIHKLSLL